MDSNLNKLCRTCLFQNKDFISIYDEEKSNDFDCVYLLGMLTNSMPNRSDGLPGQVCLTCFQEIKCINSFKLKCINSESVLRKMLLQDEDEIMPPNDKSLNQINNIEIKSEEPCCSYEENESNQKVFPETVETQEQVFEVIVKEEPALNELRLEPGYESAEESELCERVDQTDEDEDEEELDCKEENSDQHDRTKELDDCNETNGKCQSVLQCPNCNKEKPYEMFIIVKHKSVIEVVPACWAVYDPESQTETVYWPRKNLKAKRYNPYSLPDLKNLDEWFAGKERVIKRHFENFDDANAEADRLLSAASVMSESQLDQKRLARKNMRKKLYREADVPKNMYSVEKKSRVEEPVQMLNPDPIIFSEDVQMQDESIVARQTNSFNYMFPNGTRQPAVMSSEKSNQVPIRDNNSMAETVNVLTKMSSQIKTLEEGMKLLLGGQQMKSGTCTHCFHCYPHLLNEVIAFDKIKTEGQLNDLENSLLDDNYKQQFLKLCFSVVGVERKKEDITTCCLELSKEIFDKSFWSQTTWLGTKETGGDKFAFNKHDTFINFFKFVICKSTNFTPPKQFFAQFFQGRAKNCGQYLKANTSRHPASRTKAKVAEKRKLSTKSDDITR